MAKMKAQSEVTGGRIGFHPLANIFPLIDGAAFDELVESVTAAGLREKIVLFEGKILDGRNRYKALLAAGLLGPHDGPRDDAGNLRSAIFEEYDSGRRGDPLRYVLDHNLHRRHLTDDQRRMVAGRVTSLGRGGDRRSAEFKAANGGIDRGAAAKMLAVDESGVERAKAVLAHGVEELQTAVDESRVTVRLAADMAKLPAVRQKEILAHADRKVIGAVMREERARRQAEKKERREQREVDLAARQLALPAKRYGVIYADPEWRFEPWSRETGMDRAADNHYPTSELADIKSRDVASIAAPDCALFLWATSPMLPQALEVMAAWGFRYVSHVIWHKKRRLPKLGQLSKHRGTGYWFTGEHELLLLGTRGNIPAPAPGRQFPSVIDGPVGQHSKKPERFSTLIEEYFPNLPRIELNARKARPGWDAWGLEAPKGEAA